MKGGPSCAIIHTVADVLPELVSPTYLAEHGVQVSGIFFFIFEIFLYF